MRSTGNREVHGTELSAGRGDEFVERRVAQEGKLLIAPPAYVQAQYVVVESDDAVEVTGHPAEVPDAFELGAWRRFCAWRYGSGGSGGPNGCRGEQRDNASESREQPS